MEKRSFMRVDEVAAELGEEKQSTKRGFKTKREALAWEREMLNKATGDLDMTSGSFIEHYTEDVKPRLKENTWQTKDNLIQTKFLPYFGKLKMNNIMPQQIIAWQNEMMNFRDENGEAYSPVYLKTIHNQLSAIFNHAVRYYNLRENPCRKAGSMGKKKNHEMSAQRLDKGGISEIRGRDDGQTAVLLRI